MQACAPLLQRFGPTPQRPLTPLMILACSRLTQFFLATSLSAPQDPPFWYKAIADFTTWLVDGNVYLDYYVSNVDHTMPDGFQFKPGFHLEVGLTNAAMFNWPGCNLDWQFSVHYDPDQSGYMTNVGITDVCEGSPEMTSIPDEFTCQQAADALKKPWRGTAEWPAGPAGCVEFNGCVEYDGTIVRCPMWPVFVPPGVYWNTGAVGGTFNDLHKICRRECTDFGSDPMCGLQSTGINCTATLTSGSGYWLFGSGQTMEFSGHIYPLICRF